MRTLIQGGWVVAYTEGHHEILKDGVCPACGPKGAFDNVKFVCAKCGPFEAWRIQQQD
jgi:ribosomal protein L37E